MFRIFIDPAMGSTGIFAIRDYQGQTSSEHFVKDIYFFNPKTNFKASPTIPEKYRNVKVMVARIADCLERVVKEEEANETEIYVEAPFIGSFGSGLELAGLSFMLIDRLLKINKAKLHSGGRLFMISSAMVSGKDTKAKRQRKERKPFAIEEWKFLRMNIPSSTFYGVETLAKAGDDVATAFLFWFYCFGPGLEPKKKDQPKLQEVSQDFFENIYTGEDDGS